MYMMKAHELMSVWGVVDQGKSSCLFVSSPLSTNTVGESDRSCCFHAFSFSLYVDPRQEGKANPVSSTESVFPPFKTTCCTI